MEMKDDLRALELEHVAICFNAGSVIKITSSTHFPQQFLVLYTKPKAELIQIQIP